MAKESEYIQTEKLSRRLSCLAEDIVVASNNSPEVILPPVIFSEEVFGTFIKRGKREGATRISTRLNKKGRERIQESWSRLLDPVGGEDADLALIKEAVTRASGQLKTHLDFLNEEIENGAEKIYERDFVRLVRRSFAGRLANLEIERTKQEVVETTQIREPESSPFRKIGFFSPPPLKKRLIRILPKGSQVMRVAAGIALAGTAALAFRSRGEKMYSSQNVINPSNANRVRVTDIYSSPAREMPLQVEQIVASPTQTFFPTELSPSPTPIAIQATEAEMYVHGTIDFSSQEKETLKENVSIVVSSVNGETQNLSFKPYLVGEEGSQERFATEVYFEKYGNTVIQVDSGYNPETLELLPAEELRNKIEGGTLDTRSILLPREESLQYAKEVFLGAQTVIKIGEESGNFVVAAVGNIPHELLDEYNKSMGDVLDVIRLANPILDENGNPVLDINGNTTSSFDIFTYPENQGIFVIFCGWGPRNERGWPTWSRWVIALLPAQSR